MFDPCSCEVRSACALAFLAACASIFLSVRLMRYVMRETKRLRDKADLELRVSQALIQSDGERSAALPPAPRPR